MKNHLSGLFRDMPILPLLIVSFVLAIFFVPHFFSVYNLKNYLLQSADLLIISCGLTFVVLNGGIDFSVTSILALGSVVGAYIMALSPLAGQPALSIPIAILAMMSIGVLVGLLNGFSVVKLKMPSFVATLATQLIVLGLAVQFASMVSESSSITGLPEAFFVLGGEGKYFLVPILIAFSIWLISNWLLNRTIFGKRVFAIGVNPKASFISGIPVKKTIIMLMVISGLLAGIASIIATARNQVGMASLGDQMFLTTIASVIVGGTSTSGGFGGVNKTLLGVLFITLLNNTMNLLGVGWYTIMIVLGVLVVVSAMSSYVLNHRKRVS
ncbi:MAG: ABC transporter permease [Verrucomicrobia bacterium]|nr:ABC transporter permease [Verrucomicrobiota bacterium]